MKDQSALQIGTRNAPTLLLGDAPEPVIATPVRSLELNSIPGECLAYVRKWDAYKSEGLVTLKARIQFPTTFPRHDLMHDLLVSHGVPIQTTKGKDRRRTYYTNLDTERSSAGLIYRLELLPEQWYRDNVEFDRIKLGAREGGSQEMLHSLVEVIKEYLVAYHEAHQ